MESFFAETLIHVELPGGDKQILIMRPLKIRELPALFCIMRKHGRAAEISVEALKAAEEDYLSDLLAIMLGTIEGNMKKLPVEVLKPFFANFYDLNFPEVESKKAKVEDKKKRSFPEIWFARSLDFLINQGHVFSEIQEYTLPQFRVFIEVAIERITGKIKEEPKDALEVLSGF
ncbi:MAG: hypothetical protein V3T30_02220, partial [Thermodesulfobacteriota bacterium]